MATTKKNVLTVAKFYEVLSKYFEVQRDVELPEGVSYEDFAAKLAKLDANAHKTSSRPKTETPAQKQRKANAAKVLAYMEKNPEEPITIAKVRDVAEYVNSVQGAVSIINYLTVNGKVVKAEDKKDGHTAYVLA